MSDHRKERKRLKRDAKKAAKVATQAGETYDRVSRQAEQARNSVTLIEESLSSFREQEDWLLETLEAEHDDAYQSGRQEGRGLPVDPVVANASESSEFRTIEVDA